MRQWEGGGREGGQTVVWQCGYMGKVWWQCMLRDRAKSRSDVVTHWRRDTLPSWHTDVVTHWRNDVSTVTAVRCGAVTLWRRLTAAWDNYKCGTKYKAAVSLLQGRGWGGATHNVLVKYWITLTVNWWFISLKTNPENELQTKDILVLLYFHYCMLPDAVT